MMKKQKIGAVVLTGVMLLGLSGCGAAANKAKAYSKYVELGKYKGIEYTKTVAEVTDDQVQSQVDSFVNGLAETEEVKDRAVEDEDIVNIDFVGTMDGEVFDGGSGEGYELTIGSGNFIQGFEEGLIGHNIGEEVSLDLQFPDPYDNDPDKAGKDVNFKVTINSISVKTVPELTDALVTDNTEYDTIEAYKNSIKEDLEKQAESSADSQVESDIFNKVLENCKITGYDEKEVKELVDAQFSQFKQTAESYEAYGYTYEAILEANGYTSEDELKEGLTEYCKSYLDQKMVLYCIAREEGIKATSDETDALVKEYMENYGVDNEEEVYDYFGDDYFEYRIISDKVMELLKKEAILVDSTEEATEETTEDGATSEEAASEE
ncbi:MAG: trigger factor [Clostridium sp.]|nr:trigger factor [Clostridium sp.]